MKKTLVALAAVSAVSAFAQSTVTLYGSVDAGPRSQSNADTKGNASGVYMQSGYIKSNRIGFQGMEDMGGGLAANFRLEGNMDVSTGTEGSFLSGSNNSRIFDREAWVSVGTKDTTLKLGRQYHPVFSAYCQVSTTYCMGGGYYNTATALDWGVNTVGKRWDQMINAQIFASPMVEANVAYSTGANWVSSNNGNTQITPGQTSAGKGSGFNLILKPMDGLTAVFASQSANNTNNTAGTLYSLTTLGSANTALVKATTTLAGASYTTGPMTYRATLTSAKTDAATAEKLTTSGLGAKYVSGPWELNASWTSTTENSATTATDATKSKTIVAWAQYNLSKTAFWYVGLDNTKWDSGFVGSLVAATAAAGLYGGLPAAASATSGTSATSINGFVAGFNKSF